MMKLLVLAVAVFCVSVQADQYITSKVGLYYEALCPYSKSFIVGSLWDAYTNVPELINDLQLVPYGNEKEYQNANGSYYYTCQHGANECESNQLEACLIEYYPDYHIHYPIIDCMENQRHPWESLNNCSNGYDMTQVNQCYTDLEGTKLEHQYKLQQDQLNPSLAYVPWILINDVHTDDIQNQAQNDLTRYLCNLQTGDCPQGCYNQKHMPGCHPVAHTLP